MLPATLSSSEGATFWSRTEEAKDQLEEYLESPKLVSRLLEMNKERALKAKRFAKEDDEALAVKDTPYYVPRAKKSAEETAKELLAARKDTPYYVPREMKSEKQMKEEILSAKKDTSCYVDREPPKPSIPLLGLSQVNNVDRLYTDDLYPSIDLVSIAAGTRKAKGGILVFLRTFKGRLYLSLGWDMNGFKESLVEEFGERVKGGIDEFLVHSRECCHIKIVTLSYYSLFRFAVFRILYCNENYYTICH